MIGCSGLSRWERGAFGEAELGEVDARPRADLDQLPGLVDDRDNRDLVPHPPQADRCSEPADAGAHDEHLRLAGRSRSALGRLIERSDDIPIGSRRFSAATNPTILTRFADTHVAHGQPLVLPSVGKNLDFEGELVAVLGREVFRETPEEASDAVAGWSCYNDGSVRDWQFHTNQWMPGKNFPKTGGFGPWMVTADEVGSVGDLELTTRVNDEIVQHPSLSDLLFDVPALISYVSQFTLLAAGDLLLTGTPGSVGTLREPPLWLSPGDTVTINITRAGTLRNELWRNLVAESNKTHVPSTRLGRSQEVARTSTATIDSPGRAGRRRRTDQRAV